MVGWILRRIEDFWDWLSEKFYAYRKPLYLLFISEMLYRLLGGVPVNFRRDIMPELTDWQTLLMVVNFIIMQGCIIWMSVIHYLRTNSRN